MSENKTRISNASSYSEIGEYWDTHDLSEHWDETKDVVFEVSMNRREGPWDIISAFGSELNELNKVRTLLGERPFVGRMLIRTLFSIFDGYAWYLKQRALDGASAAGIEFTPDELEIIREQRTKALPSGETRVVPVIEPTKRNLKFAICAYARVRHVNSPLLNNSLPDEFHTVAEVRNRITHPKSSADFVITQPEANAVARLLKWFMELVAWAGEQEQNNISDVKERIDEMFAEARRNHAPPRK